ncbi:hypothetical protein CCOS191_2133 [Pseudomonas sp. CCOS 191]|nr:hypothetical protein CCOS191_2133 [Pseudomonas sp. CCOS 191]
MQTKKLLAGDHAQSIIVAQSGMGRKEIQYSPYGHRKELESAPRTGFIGQYCESDFGWYFLGNGYRVYNPVIMRFHSPDVGFSPFGRAGINSYAYVTGNPIGRHDRSGRFEEWGATFYGSIMSDVPSLESVFTYLVNTVGVLGPAVVWNVMSRRGVNVPRWLQVSLLTSQVAGVFGNFAQGLLDVGVDNPALPHLRTFVSGLTAISIVASTVQGVRDVNSQQAQNARASSPENIGRHIIDSEQPAYQPDTPQGRVRKRSASPGQSSSLQIESEIGPTPKGPQRHTKADLGNASRFPLLTPSIKRKF